MKKYITLFLITIFSLNLFGNVKDYDPRRFVVIYEENSSSRVPIWSWEEPYYLLNDENKMNYNIKSLQKKQILDYRSKVVIDFNNIELINTSNFEGNITIGARINGNEIEVFPYSRIGHDREYLLVGSRPINEIASKISSVVYNLDALIMEFAKKNPEYYNQLIDEKIELIEKRSIPNIEISIDKLRRNISQLESEKVKIGQENEKKFMKIDLDDNDILQQINEIDGSIAVINDRLIRYEKVLFMFQIYLSDLKTYSNKTDNYSDEISQYYLKKLTTSLEYFAEINNDSKTSAGLNQITSRMFDDYLIRQELLKDLARWEKFGLEEGIDNAINKLLALKLSILNEFQTEYLIELDFSSISNVNTAAWNDLITEVRKLISSYVYKNLIYASIDLQEVRAAYNDDLEIYLLWYDPLLKKTLELPLGRYTVQKIGWEVSITDSFMLVEQFDKPEDSTESFSGAAGANLLYRYHHGDSIKAKDISFGINVSYLDFDDSNEIEIGVGIVLGFLDDNIFFTAGRNLNTEENQGYMGIGFSFVNLASTFNEISD